MKDPDVRVTRRGGNCWLASAWVGLAAGLVDATASWLHATSPRLLLFAPWLYVPLALAICALAVGSRALLDRMLPDRPARPAGRLARALRNVVGLPYMTADGPRAGHCGWVLGKVVGLLVLFFGAYWVTTSPVAAFASRQGQLRGLIGVFLVAVVVFLIVRALGARRARRAAPAPEATSGSPARRLPARLALALLIAFLLVYPVLAAIHLSRDGHAPAAGPAPRGFVLVSLDAARGDHISGLGYPRPTTPFTDELVAAGTAFRRAYVQMPASGPGHASMLTGLPPLSHGVLQNTGILQPQVVTVAERLRAEGFHTAGFVNNYYLDGRFGFDQGFETYIDQYRASRLAGWDPRMLLRGTALFHAWHRLVHAPGVPTDDTIDLTLDWLRHRPAGDFFVFLHVMDPHAPYDPPQDLRELFLTGGGGAAGEGEVPADFRDTPALRDRLDQLTPAERKALSDLYDGDLALGDRKIGRLVAELRRLGLLESTLVVVTADHGEILDEKGAVFDHGLIWNGNLNVPLVMSYPGHLAAGRVVERPVAATAIVPTACALLGVPYEEQTGASLYGPLVEPLEGPPVGPAQSSRLDTDAAAGTATGAAVGGAAGGTAGETAAAGGAESSRLDTGAAAPEAGGGPIVHALAELANRSPATAAIDRHHKLVTVNGRIEMLFDLDGDPAEELNLWPTEDSRLLEEARRLAADLNEWIEATRSHAVATPEVDRTADRETRRRLRALGYVN